MKFSMNGFRKNLSRDTATLRDIVQAVVDGNYYDKQDLIDAINQIITHSNVINCVFQKDDPDFSDISDIEIEHLEGI